MRGPLVSFFILFLLASCGGAPDLSGAPSFIAGQILLQGDGSGLSMDRRLARTWRDYDGDGVADRLDWDIDGDGIANLLDQYPFDEKRWGEDKDGDGIADFVDLSFATNSKLKDIAFLQEEIYRDLGVVIINGSDEFSPEQWAVMKSTLYSEIVLKKLTYKELKVVVMYSIKDRSDARRADYDPHWKQISFYAIAEHYTYPEKFKGVFAHELGHVHAQEVPQSFQSFLDSFFQWTSPSQYGQSSPDEGYAENFAYELWQQGLEFDASRFDLI
jgi:hypothetical protein